MKNNVRKDTNLGEEKILITIDMSYKSHKLNFSKLKIASGYIHLARDLVYTRKDNKKH